MIHVPLISKLGMVVFGSMLAATWIIAAESGAFTTFGGILIVAVTTTISPLLLAHFTNKQRQREKAEDYKRQDEVAKKVEEAAVKITAVNKKAEDSRKVISDKVDIIHTLVNSQMTAAMQAEYDATTRELASLKEIVSLKRERGLKPTKEVTGTIEATEIKIAELRVHLDERIAQDKVVQQQQKQQLAAGKLNG